MNMQELFRKVKKSFPELNSKLISFNKDSVMRSGLFTGNVYYNPKLISKMGFSEKAIVGISAHELSHQIDFKDRSFFYLFSYRFRFKSKSDFKRRSERAADIITVKRGFGNELIHAMGETRKKFGKERYSSYQAAHLTIDEVKDLMLEK